MIRISLNREQFNELIRGKTVVTAITPDPHYHAHQIEIGLQDIGYDAILEDTDEAYAEYLDRRASID